MIPEPFRFPRYDARLEREFCRAPRERIRQIQFARLRHAVRYAYERVPFYRARWDKAGAHPDDLAYILSTSGTTGVPRLVPVTHKDVPGSLLSVPGTRPRRFDPGHVHVRHDGGGLGLHPGGSGAGMGGEGLRPLRDG